MSQPTFTLWPWKVLSMLVPAMALGAAALAVKNNAPKEDSISIFFSVVAAGNAYLFAMAIGDFGRSVIAIPIGAVAGWVTVGLFSHAAPGVIFLVVIGIVLLSSIFTKSTDSSQGCLALILLFLLGVAVADGPRRGDPIRSAIVGYPFVCAAVAGSMPLRRDAYGVWLASMAGARAALHGMVAGGFIFVLATAFTRMVIRGMGSTGIIGIYLLFLLGCMMVNYFCVKFIFTAVHRVVAPAPVSAAPQDEVVFESKEDENLTPKGVPEQAPESGGVKELKDSE